MASVCLATSSMSAWAREIALQAKVPSTAAEAAATFDQRRLAVLSFNACGREVHFDAFMQKLRSGDLGSQGEDTSDLVLAKIALGNTGCTFTEIVPNGDPMPLLTQAPACADRQQAVGPDKLTRRTTILQPSCLHQQINQAIQAYRKHDKPGSSDLPCLPIVSGANPLAADYAVTKPGEYDVDVAHLVRMLYSAGRGLLDDETVAHLWNELLSIRGAPGVESYSPIYDCGNTDDELGLPDDYADRQDAGDSLLDDLGDGAEYLLKRLFLIALFYYTGGITSALHEVLPLIPPINIPPLLGAVPAAFDPFVFARIPETENHLLLIESSRYLTDQAMVADMVARGRQADIGNITRQQRATRDWLLKRLQRIAMNDFEEYNARSYQRYSLLAISNLHDFAEHESLRTAARIVLDYASAKTAIGSNLGRRFAPFRRRAEYDGFSGHAGAANLYNRVEGGDFGAARLMMLTGPAALEFTPVLQNLLATAPAAMAGRTPLYAGEPGAGGGAGGFDNLVTTAMSSYRLPDPIAELAVERIPVVQRLRHAGAEAYSSGASFLLTAGGLNSGAANATYGQGKAVDSGAAMPTTLMLTDEGLSVFDLVRFEGVGIGSERTPSVCLAAGFSCGVNLVIPQNIRDCGQQVNVGATTWTFVNSTSPKCNFFGIPATDPRRHHFHLAIASRNCSFNDGICGPGGPGSYGFLQVVDAPAAGAANDAAFAAFRASRPAALNWPNGVEGTYRTSAGRLLEFSIPSGSGPSIHLGAGGIRSIDGVIQVPLSSWHFLADGPIRANHDGVITITNPASKKAITLDLHDWTTPAWTKNYRHRRGAAAKPSRCRWCCCSPRRLPRPMRWCGCATSTTNSAWAAAST